LELASANVRFCTVSRGVSWLSQWSVVQTRSESQVFMYRMRVLPPPLSVTLPWPSMTMSSLASLRTLAGRSSVMVMGSGPQLKRMTPPRSTAAMKASPVQLAGLPLPTMLSAPRLSTGWPSRGTAQSPSGLPATGRSSKLVGGTWGAPADTWAASSVLDPSSAAGASSSPARLCVSAPAPSRSRRGLLGELEPSSSLRVRALSLDATALFSPSRLVVPGSASARLQAAATAASMMVPDDTRHRFARFTIDLTGCHQ
jgi:hypothetical protein